VEKVRREAGYVFRPIAKRWCALFLPGRRLSPGDLDPATESMADELVAMTRPKARAALMEPGDFTCGQG
jgi:hypothetical protein